MCCCLAKRTWSPSSAAHPHNAAPLPPHRGTLLARAAMGGGEKPQIPLPEAPLPRLHHGAAQQGHLLNLDLFPAVPYFAKQQFTTAWPALLWRERSQSPSCAASLAGLRCTMGPGWLQGQNTRPSPTPCECLFSYNFTALSSFLMCSMCKVYLV